MPEQKIVFTKRYKFTCPICKRTILNHSIVVYNGGELYHAKHKGMFTMTGIAYRYYKKGHYNHITLIN